MAGSVVKVQSFLPKYFSCDTVQISSAASMKKYSARKPQHSTYNKGKMLFFYLSCFSNGNGSGNIGCSRKVMAAGICHKQLSWLNFYITFFIGTVMNDRTMLSISTDRCKTGTDKSVLHCTKFFQFLRGGQFCDRKFSAIRLEPVHESGMGNSVF